MLNLEEARAFHGHLGPFLALGYMAGSIAVRELKPEDEHDLEAKLKIPLKRPFSCIIDGVQCSSGCTLGKGNIFVEDSEEFLLVFRKGDKSLMLEVKEGVIERFLSLGMEEGVRWLLSRKEEEVFRITWP